MEVRYRAAPANLSRENRTCSETHLEDSSKSPAAANPMPAASEKISPSRPSFTAVIVVGDDHSDGRAGGEIIFHHSGEDVDEVFFLAGGIERSLTGFALVEFRLNHLSGDSDSRGNAVDESALSVRRTVSAGTQSRKTSQAV